MAVVVGLFTSLAVAVVWGLSLQMQAQLRDQLLAQAEQRALQLADAMAGQTQAFTRLADQALLDLRDQWTDDPQNFPGAVNKALNALPAGLVSHVTVVDADGAVVYNSLGVPPGASMADRPHFQQLREGADRLVLGEPVLARLNGRWLFVVGRPIMRGGRFAGAVHLLMSTEFLAGVLNRLSLSPKDTVTLVHPDGRILARSLDNTAAMQQSLPPSRPFLVERMTERGVFRQTAVVDNVPRLFGWHRMQPTGAVLVVGLSEAGVLEPLAASRRQAVGLSVALSLALAAIGAWIGWLQWRLELGHEAMQASRRQLEEAQRIAQMGHWTFDTRQGTMTWSDEIYRIFGQSPDRFRPDFAGYWAQVHPDERTRLKALFDDAMANRCDLDDVHRIVRPDGSERYIRLICQSAPTEHGPTYHGTLQDVTELRQAQLALQQLNSGLERRVKSRTKELQALNRELETFTYSVSHDLRTPLRSIHGFATLLQESEADRLSSEGQGFLRRIQDSSRRMGELINDLLAMARHSRAEIRPEWVDLSAMAHSVVAELERAEPQRQVAWDIEAGLQVQADPVLMRLVLQNLLGNAWKYTGHTPDARIRLFLAPEHPPGQACFCVSDNGAGFDPAYAGQLFQPFKRLHNSQQFEGSGIGLATVARIVQRHGGAVRAEGQVGQGARFWFSLPLEPVRPFGDSANGPH